jgi:hypothetical protein
MATMSKLMLSESADGDGINITTASPIDGSDTLIHTAVSGTTDKDLVTLFAYNDHTAAVVLHLKWGDTTDSIKLSVSPQAGLALIVADLPISDGNTIAASAATVDVITIYGYVNRVDVA